jgi:uncharacterized protein (TIGR02246 family)
MTADEQAICALQQTWIDATARGDLQAVLALMADDIVFLTPGRPPFGRDEFAAAFTSGVGKMQFSGKAEFEEVLVSGDFAYARGKLALTLTPTGGPAKRLAGYTLSVFRRVNGRWVLARDANFVGPVD